MVEIIQKKRDGYELSKQEIEYVIAGVLSNEIPDYQITAFLMAIYFRKLNEQETIHLTNALVNSGKQIDLSGIPGIKVDKHSTGGVGDKTTIILMPLMAAAGVPMAKISGRGLGHTGGTIDKLESITGFKTNLSIDELVERVRLHHVAIAGQSQELVPADKKLYALRDITATVDNLGLMTSSIMSKKIASGANGIVIDLKLGSGAYIHDIDKAQKLGQTMINIGRRMNRKVVVVISSMNQPLGNMIGNALEIKEGIEILQNNGPNDLRQLCLTLGANMLLLAEKTKSIEEGITLLSDLLGSGIAFHKFKDFVQSQGGDVGQIRNTELLPQSPVMEEYIAKESGYISTLDALEIGRASMLLGAGRETKISKIDHGAGIVLHKKIGDLVKKGESLARLYTNNETNILKAEVHLRDAYKFSDKPSHSGPLIYATMN